MVTVLTTANEEIGLMRWTSTNYELQNNVFGIVNVLSKWQCQKLPHIRSYVHAHVRKEKKSYSKKARE